MNSQEYLLLGGKSVTPFPPIPTRAEVLGVNMHFRGGLIVPSSTYGKIPWWPSALSWLSNYQDRMNVYQTCRSDTHVIIEVPNGYPLYNEGGQFYSPDKFGALDWTNGMTKLDSRFSDLVDEVIEQGFKYIIEMDEQVDNSLKVMQLVLETLTDKQLAYGFIMPGYDGVFDPGWPIESIMNWAARARSMRPNCYLGLEHTVGHIPLGEGGADYQPGGRMKDFDIVMGEFNTTLQGQCGDEVWQVLGRMIKYKRPPDQPAKDDPTPPFYLVDCARGPRFYCAWETDNPYHWVRIDPNDAISVRAVTGLINAEHDYLAMCGCQYIG